MSGIYCNRIIKVGGVTWLIMTSVMICFSAVEYNPERYKVILGRAPFGTDPLMGMAALDIPSAGKKNIRLSFLLENENGENRAGFQNLEPKNGEPKSGIILVGESFMGMKLMEIDFFNSEARMDYKGRPVTFHLATTPIKKEAPRVSVRPRSRINSRSRRQEVPIQERREEPESSIEEQNMRLRDIRTRMQKDQIEALRSEMSFLPVPLAQEMDDQAGY